MGKDRQRDDVVDQITTDTREWIADMIVMAVGFDENGDREEEANVCGSMDET